MLIPNTNRNQGGRELMMERWKELANGGRQGITESTSSNASRATILHKVKGADGFTYGILQENSHFFVKKTAKSINEANSADFDYIGGSQNILAERFNSASAAHRQLNAKLYSLHEAFGNEGIEKEEDKESELLNKLNQKDDSEAQPAAEVPAIGGAEGADVDPLADLEAAPAPEVDVAPVPEVDVAPAPEVDADPLAGLDAAEGEEASGEGLAADGVPAEGDAEGSKSEKPDATTHDAMRTLGKLGQQLDAIGEISTPFAKTILGTIITKLKRVLPNMDDNDIEKLQQRLGKDGKEIDEDTADEMAMDEAFNDHNDSAYHDHENQMSSEHGQDSGIPSFDNFMDNNGFANNDNDIIKGISAFSAKLYEMSEKATDQDFQEIANMMNPFIWSNLGNVSEDIINGVAEKGGVDMENDGEWPIHQAGQALNESWSSVEALTRLLVRAELTKSKK